VKNLKLKDWHVRNLKLNEKKKDEEERVKKEIERKKTMNETTDPNFVLEGYPMVGVPLTATFKGKIEEKAKYIWLRKSESGLFEAIADYNQPTYKLTLKDFKNILKCVMILDEEPKALAATTKEPVSIVDGYGVVLKVNLMDGKNLEKKDKFTRKSDPFCILTMGKQRFISRPKPRKLNPVWNESFEFRTIFPVVEKFKLSVFSWERFVDKKSMGSIVMDLRDLKIGEIVNRIAKLENCTSGEINLSFQIDFINTEDKSGK